MEVREWMDDGNTSVSEFKSSNSNQIFINVATGNTVTLDVDVTKDTVHDIKDRLYEMEGVAPIEQVLTYRGKVLSSKHTLSHHHIEHHSHLNMSIGTKNTNVSPLKVLLLNSEPATFPFDPSQSLYDLTEDIRRDFGQNIIRFIHRGVVYPSDSTIRLSEIEHLQNDGVLHTKSVALFAESAIYPRRIRVELDSIYHPLSVYSVPDSREWMDRPLDELIREAISHCDLSPKFLESDCPFGAVSICHNGVAIEPDRGTENTVTSFIDYGCTKGAVGQLPTKYMPLPKRTLSEFTLCFPECDCCLDATKEPEAVYKLPRAVPDCGCPGCECCSGASGHRHHLGLRYDNPKGAECDGDDIVIRVTLPDQSFLFKNDYFGRFDGRFYPLESSKFPVMLPGQDLVERRMVYGYMRWINGHSQFCFQCIPQEVVSLIFAFFPPIYGGRYVVKEHNPHLKEEGTGRIRREKTNTFMVQDFEMSLVRNVSMASSRLYLSIRRATARLAEVNIMVSVLCTETQESHISHKKQMIFGPHRAGAFRIPLCFENRVSLCSLICDVQIISISEYEERGCYPLYRHPVVRKYYDQTMNWSIASDIVHEFKQQIPGTVAKRNGFICSLNKKGDLEMTIRLEGDMLDYDQRVSAKCLVSESTTKTTHQFDACFVELDSEPITVVTAEALQYIKPNMGLFFRVGVAFDDFVPGYDFEYDSDSYSTPYY